MVTNLFAVLHEALTNVAQHARARTVEVDITVAAGTVTLCVVDDGVGMAGAPRDGGLADLRRRAVWHGGTLSVERAATGGTRLTWAVPQRRSSAAAKRAGLPAGGWVTRGLPDAMSAQRPARVGGRAPPAVRWRRSAGPGWVSCPAGPLGGGRFRCARPRSGPRSGMPEAR